MKTSYINPVIETLNARSWDEVIHHGVVLVDFSQPWCQPCRVQLPILERVAKRLEHRATIAVVNVDDLRTKAVDLNVQSIPTLVLFEEGKVIRTFAGIHSEREIVAELEAAVNHLNAACS